VTLKMLRAVVGFIGMACVGQQVDSCKLTAEPAPEDPAIVKLTIANQGNTDLFLARPPEISLTTDGGIEPSELPLPRHDAKAHRVARRL
jgi:hypothetical protein